MAGGGAAVTPNVENVLNLCKFYIYFTTMKIVRKKITGFQRQEVCPVTKVILPPAFTPSLYLKLAWEALSV